MDNPYPRLIETPDANRSLGMWRLNGVYTQGFNRRHQRGGPLWQGRFQAVLFQKGRHLLAACRDAVRNPVRVQAVDQPQQWPGSSSGATAERHKAHPSVTTDWIFGQFTPRRATVQAVYRQCGRAGRQAGSLWRDRCAQSMLGEAPVADRLRSQIWGPARNAAAVEGHGYTQQAIAAHLRLHFTSISRILRRGRGQ